MGIALLDFQFRVEKAFHLKILSGSYTRIFQGKAWKDITAGELHDWVLQLCREQNVAAPPDSWDRVRLAIAQYDGISPDIIHRETFVVRELGYQ